LLDYLIPVNMNFEIKTKLYRFWETGYFYLALSILLFIIYGLNGRVGIYDWQKEVAYFQYIKASLASFHTLPWFWRNKLDNVAWYPAAAYSSSFIGNPETMLFSPFTPLLFLMGVLPYVKFLAVIHCLIGIAGIFALKRRFQWDSRQFRTYSILFLLSPIIFQHLAIGYTPWLNLFFFPWLVYFIAGANPASSILGTSAVLGLVLLEGGTHSFVWYALLAALYFSLRAWFERKWSGLLRLVGIFCLAALLSSARLYATAQAYGGFRQSFQVGYNPLNFTFWALVPPVLIAPMDTLFSKMVWMGVPSWDGGLFWGAALLMALALAMSYRGCKRAANFHSADQNLTLIYDSLWIASSILLILSFFSIFEWIINAANSLAPIPFSVGVEKYPFRLAIPAFLGFSVVIAAYSKEISYSLDQTRHRLSQFQILTRSLNGIKFLTLVLTIGLSAAFLLSVIFSRSVLGISNSVIQGAYAGTGNSWLSGFMPGKSTHPLEYYLGRAAAMYSQLQVSLLAGAAILIVALWFLRSRVWKTEYASEFALAVPMIFASVMWLSLSISVPYTQYPVQKVLPPLVVTEPPGLAPDINVSPQEITLLPPQGSRVTRYIFPGISRADSQSLYVASNNAAISETGGRMSIVPQDERPIVIEFNSTPYDKAIALSALAWAGVIGFGIARLILSLRGRKEISTL
jgi:hypothetical protein